CRELVLFLFAVHIELFDGIQIHRQLAPVDSNALVPVALGGDHHISLIQHKHSDFFGVNELVLGAPIVDCARCTNDNLLLQLEISFLHKRLHIWTKFPHLLNDLTSLLTKLCLLMLGLSVL
uniref:Secreted protein n=1 Tax=Oreochromis niloticus TaxID=8128 RepID=A0A669DPA3_ORENI